MTGGGWVGRVRRAGRVPWAVRVLRAVWVPRAGRTLGEARAAFADGGPAPSDRGSATVWTVGAIAVLCVVFGAVLAMGQAVVVRHRAAGAADLAALAAADHWMNGSTAACAQADRVARTQRARLVRCAVEGEISDVTAASGKGPFAAEVRSRAGPAGPVDPRPPARALRADPESPPAGPTWGGPRATARRTTRADPESPSVGATWGAARAAVGQSTRADPESAPALSPPAPLAATP
ncbi:MULTISPECIES: Rv3654c family TadE-like protein [Streptomyces]|uniref:Rv3654c family TadE-like protein n=1 Tax=Streptomyces TaxID=1883 RepID=UPI0035A19347